MNKLHHPSNRAERLRIKRMKDTFVDKYDRSKHASKRELQEIEAKEQIHELRNQVLGEEEEE